MKVNYITFPDADEIRESEAGAPDYMFPNRNPYAVIIEGALDTIQCDEIQREAMRLHPYKFQHCGAVTRELPRPLSKAFNPVFYLMALVNEAFWNQAIHREHTAAWHQHYEVDGDYQMHMDGAAGVSRKFTAVVLLTASDRYSGGVLELFVPPASRRVPKTRGTVVIFPHWVMHRVTPIEHGFRDTLNLGFFGPPHI